MRNGGFFERRSTNHAGLGIVILGHAVLLTAIALNPTRFGPRVIFIPTIDSIRAQDPPPPEPPPPPQPTDRWKAEPTRPRPIVDTPAGPAPFALDPPAADPGPVTIAPPLAEPMFRQARMDPGAIGRFQPPYPSSMVRNGVEGSVTVKVLIGADGRVRSIELVDATHAAFFDTTRDHALRAWRFQPATRDGVAVESWRTMTVRFRLDS